jgi:hypothetical protein
VSSRLFGPTPAGAGDPGEGDRAFLEELEAKAREVDRLASGERSDETVAEEHAKRRALLMALDAAGLLTEERWEDRRRWLDRWGLHDLLAYHDAAIALHTYLRSEERREHVPEVVAEGVLGATVSVDWFRLGSPAPEGRTPYAWLGECERLFRAATLPPGAEGVFLTHEGGPWLRLRWRKDDGVTAALVSGAAL